MAIVITPGAITSSTSAHWAWQEAIGEWMVSWLVAPPMRLSQALSAIRLADQLDQAAPDMTRARLRSWARELGLSLPEAELRITRATQQAQCLQAPAR